MKVERHLEIPIRNNEKRQNSIMSETSENLNINEMKEMLFSQTTNSNPHKSRNLRISNILTYGSGPFILYLLYTLVAISS